MATGLYQNLEVVERYQGTPATGAVTQPFMLPYDADVLGMVISTSAAVGATMTVNVQAILTSQQGPYTGFTPANPNPVIPAAGGQPTNSIWTGANVPSVLSGNKTNLVPQYPLVVNNVPYMLNYPLPGPAGTTGFWTAQQTTAQMIAQGGTNPVVTPPNVPKYQMSSLVQPDNTYTDLNGVTGAPASFLHMGDVITFVVGGTAGGTTLQMELLLAHR